ncbi:MAG TPA: aquaporin [Bacteroidales bacterium]|nr:aquaporin [Bacteroidales bacterium]HNS46184.1 aquaporin [Bacteroidales bacterium]
MSDVNNFSFRKRIFFSEFIGTALLVLLGLSVVILMFGEGSPLGHLLPNVKLRQTITGFLFGSIGASIALSPVGKVSGAHINPAVTMTFWLFRKIDSRISITYILAQLTGGIVGALPLLVWGAMGRSVSFGATLPGEGYSMLTVLLGEVVITFTMVLLLVVFIGFRQIRTYTPAIFPVLFAIMVPLEAAISGTSANPARSIGPAIISGDWQGWWIYWVGPVAGALLASLAGSALARRITVAKLYYFDSDRDGLLRRMESSDT